MVWPAGVAGWAADGVPVASGWTGAGTVGVVTSGDAEGAEGDDDASGVGGVPVVRDWDVICDGAVRGRGAAMAAWEEVSTRLSVPGRGRGLETGGSGASWGFDGCGAAGGLTGAVGPVLRLAPVAGGRVMDIAVAVGVPGTGCGAGAAGSVMVGVAFVPRGLAAERLVSAAAAGAGVGEEPFGRTGRSCGAGSEAMEFGKAGSGWT